MTITLITGANKGLGHEAARRLLAAGHDVWVAARDADRGAAAADALGARFVALDVTTDPERLESTIVGLAYPASKTALNMLTSMYAKALPHMRINAVDPGYTATDFNNHSGVQTVEEGTDAIVRMALLDGSGPTGTFTDRHGAVPW